MGSVVLLVVAMSTERWVTGRILCQTGAEIVNASNPEMEQFSGYIYYGLFQGGKTKKCGLGSRRTKIYSRIIILTSSIQSIFRKFVVAELVRVTYNQAQ